VLTILHFLNNLHASRIYPTITIGPVDLPAHQKLSNEASDPCRQDFLYLKRGAICDMHTCQLFAIKLTVNYLSV